MYFVKQRIGDFERFPAKWQWDETEYMCSLLVADASNVELSDEESMIEPFPSFSDDFSLLSFYPHIYKDIL